MAIETAMSDPSRWDHGVDILSCPLDPKIKGDHLLGSNGPGEK